MATQARMALYHNCRCSIRARRRSGIPHRDARKGVGEGTDQTELRILVEGERLRLAQGLHGGCAQLAMVPHHEVGALGCAVQRHRLTDPE